MGAANILIPINMANDEREQNNNKNKRWTRTRWGRRMAADVGGLVESCVDAPVGTSAGAAQGLFSPSGYPEYAVLGQGLRCYGGRRRGSWCRASWRCRQGQLDIG